MVLRSLTCPVTFNPCHPFAGRTTCAFGWERQRWRLNAEASYPQSRYRITGPSLRALDARSLLRERLQRPCHAGRVMGHAETSPGIEQDHAPMAVYAVFQIV